MAEPKSSNNFLPFFWELVFQSSGNLVDNRQGGRSVADGNARFCGAEHWPHRWFQSVSFQDFSWRQGAMSEERLCHKSYFVLLQSFFVLSCSSSCSLRMVCEVPYFMSGIKCSFYHEFTRCLLYEDSYIIWRNWLLLLSRVTTQLFISVICEVGISIFASPRFRVSE